MIVYGREKIVYSSWSANLGDRDDRVNLIGSGNLPLVIVNSRSYLSNTTNTLEAFQYSEPPIICYKYNKPIRNTVFNFNKLVSDLDIHANTPES